MTVLALFAALTSPQVKGDPEPTVRVLIAGDGSCMIANSTVACREVGSILRQMAVPLDAHIRLVADPKVKYDTIRVAVESLQGTGYKLGVALVTQ